MLEAPGNQVAHSNEVLGCSIPASPGLGGLHQAVGCLDIAVMPVRRAEGVQHAVPVFLELSAPI